MTEEKDIPRFCIICQSEADWKIKYTPFFVCEDCKKVKIEKGAELVWIKSIEK